MHTCKARLYDLFEFDSCQLGWVGLPCTIYCFLNCESAVCIVDCLSAGSYKKKQLKVDQQKVEQLKNDQQQAKQIKADQQQVE